MFFVVLKILTLLVLLLGPKPRLGLEFELESEHRMGLGSKTKRLAVAIDIYASICFVQRKEKNFSVSVLSDADFKQRIPSSK